MNQLATMQLVKAETVDFNGTGLITVQKDGKEYVAMKPIVEGMGLDWYTQLRKINKSKRYSHMTLPIQTTGGAQEMLCILLKKLNGWLFSINPEKVKPEAREYVIQYQDECFQVLYDYWNNGKTENPRAAIPTEAIPTLETGLQIAGLFGFEGNQKVFAAANWLKSETGIDALEKLGVTHLINPDQQEHLTPTELGEQLGDFGPRQINDLLEAHGYQTFWHSTKVKDGKEKKTKHWTPTESGKPHSVLLDTKKAHSDGTPVQQLKWKASMISLLKQKLKVVN